MNMRDAADALYRIAAKDDEDETMDPDPAEIVRVEEGQTVAEALGLVPQQEDEDK